MKLLEVLITQLKKEPNFVTDNGELKKWVVLNKAQNLDEELLELLLEAPDLREKFFLRIKDVLVFNQPVFIQFLEHKNFLNDSYTKYNNKVGLTIDNKYLKQRNEVALVWPFKDCILEGGQTREETKRDEIFFNEILAQDEITQLLEPKVLTNGSRISGNNEEQLKDFKRSGLINQDRGLPDKTISDNLIIKGNNLLALHSIKEAFSEQVKLIYIDPPYNTKSDTFKYNDSFKQSTWLTFMRNRLEIASKLLNEQGAIFVQIDHHQLGYLNVLMDEVFGKDNKVQVIAVKTASPAGFKTVNPGPIDVTEYILFYTKNKSRFEFKRSYVPVKYNENYNIYLKKDDDLTKWEFTPLKEKVIAEAGFENEAEAKKKYGSLWRSILKVMIEDYAFKNASNIVSIRDPHKPTEKLKELMQKSRKEERVIAYVREDGSTMYLYKGGALAFYSNKMKEIDGKLEVTELLTDFWNHISWAGIAKEGGVALKNGKKPEKLLKQIIELCTNKNDIILDFHLGSGTTCAVAHKLGRQYIGIEQMDYGQNDSITRLKNVMNGDATGISKAVNWQGGGEFVYVELKRYNEIFIEKISEAQDTQTLLGIWEQMKEKSFLNYNVDIKKQNEQIESFKSLPLKEQKHRLIELLDKNQLYVNLSSLEDQEFACTEHEKKITRSFYLS